MGSNVEDLKEHKNIGQLEREVTALKRENHAAMETITKLLKDLNKKQEQIDHLETLLAQTVPVVREESKVIASVSAEEEIAIFQLERLRQSAKARVLTLEEARMYDILVKNKKISQEEAQKTKPQSSYRDVSDVDLLKLLETVHKVDEPEQK
jgi:predicted  nucleic acid-binding Zn-ribbon protein